MIAPHMDLVGRQAELIERVANANPRTVVVLQTGSPVTMPWLDKVAGVIQAWYPGQECGNAIADVLFGDVNPSGGSRKPSRCGWKTTRHTSTIQVRTGGFATVKASSSGTATTRRKKYAPLFPLRLRSVVYHLPL